MHRRRLADRSERLARVLVTSPDGDPPPDADSDVVVRNYRDVLVESRIEPFLVTALHERR